MLGLMGKFFGVEIDSYVTGFGFEAGECKVDGGLAAGRCSPGVGGRIWSVGGAASCP